MVDKKEKKECCGCGACAIVCPRKAITMKEDYKGFKYPEVDMSSCSECSRCNDFCSFSSSYTNNGCEPDVYAAKAKDDSVRMTSTSGGMFTALSDAILGDNGAIYGACYSDNFEVVHMRALTKEQRDLMKSSKYVQSELGEIFIEVKKDLDDGRPVLFTGTPCQVSALNGFLNKRYDNLFTVDIICHGVPSNKLWREYLDIIRKKSRSKIAGINFRDKSGGWHKPKMIFDFSPPIDNKRLSFEKSFFQLFIDNYILRPSCYNCYYANFSRPGDITIADYWGIENVFPEFDDNKGVSLVLVNTDKGNTLFKSISSELDTVRSSKDKCLQGSLVCKPPELVKSARLWRYYRKTGIKFILFLYTDYSVMFSFFKKAMRKLQRIFKKTGG